jgi:hypothetical protein
VKELEIISLRLVITDVTDSAGTSIDTNEGEKMVKELPCTAHERDSLKIVVFSGSFTENKDVCVFWSDMINLLVRDVAHPFHLSSVPELRVT